MNINKIRKSLVAGAGALITGLAFALTDGSLSPEDVGGVVAAVLSVGGFTWRVPNATI